MLVYAVDAVVSEKCCVEVAYCYCYKASVIFLLFARMCHKPFKENVISLYYAALLVKNSTLKAGLPTCIVEAQLITMTSF